MTFNQIGYFKNASKNNCNLVFNWSNDLEVRKNSINKNKISYKEHQSWFYSKINDKNSFIWIYFIKKNQPAGLVRFERKSNKYFVSYLLDYNYRGKNISKTMLIAAIDKFIKIKPRLKKIFAKVIKDNLISLKVMKSAGFRLINNNAIIKKLYYEIKHETR